LPPPPRSHGLATPDLFVDDIGVAAFTGGATLPVGGAILALGALAAVRRPTAVRPLLRVLAAGVAFILALLREGAGAAFDRSCVEALERVLARERGAELAVAV
jgi:hypothetical protein